MTRWRTGVIRRGSGETPEFDPRPLHKGLLPPAPHDGTMGLLRHRFA